MKKFLGALSVILALSATPLAQAADNVALVDMQKLFQKSPEKMEANKNYGNSFKTREEKLQKEENDLKDRMKQFERDASTMKETDRKKRHKEIEKQKNALIAKLQSFQTDTSDFRAKESKKIFTNIQNIVKSVANKKGYTTVLDANVVIYADPKNDITDDVLSEMKQAKVNKAKK